jgi:uncharacterized protein DUF6510
MTALDGNGVASLLHDLFGQEMTQVETTCIHCQTRSILARAKVFRGPGIVLLCSHCDGRMMVIVQRENVSCVDAEGFSSLAVRLPHPVSLVDILTAGARSPQADRHQAGHRS